MVIIQSKLTFLRVYVTLPIFSRQMYNKTREVLFWLKSFNFPYKSYRNLVANVATKLELLIAKKATLVRLVTVSQFQDLFCFIKKAMIS